MSTDMVVVVRLAMLDRADYAMWSNQGWGGAGDRVVPDGANRQREKRRAVS